MKSSRRILVALLILCTVGLIGLIHLYLDQSPQALAFKRYVKYSVTQMFSGELGDETEGLDKNHSTEIYVDGTEVAPNELNLYKDVKKVYRDSNITRLVNYADGYQLDFPSGTSFDFSRSSCVVEAYGDGYEYTVSFEYCPYAEMTDEMGDGLASLVPWFSAENATEQYIGYYQSRFMLNEAWQNNNNVTVSQAEPFQAGSFRGIAFHATMEGVPDEKYDGYSYLYITLDGQDFLRIMVKYQKENSQFPSQAIALLSGFRSFARIGNPSLSTDYYPEISCNWNSETASLYRKIQASDELSWGIFTEDIYGKGIDETVPALEEKLEYRFETILAYVHYIHAFPTEFMEQTWNEGRIVELTYQLTTNNNTDFYAESPMLNIYRGEGLDQVREFARAAKEFGHPFLFRLCNEMNSDWTSYGGVVNMADPDIFVDTWRTIYEIFQEEGVDNCIWIYNPNDRNAPPNKWNDSLNYYPGNEYVHMIGVTGYNNGTYYTQWAEEWREFDTIYNEIQNLYQQPYGAFPWIITEFSSSSVGGDKVAWIENMFAHIKDYPNIKIAVWFSLADWDSEGNVARPYWLDETPETTEAFRIGLKDYPQRNWLD